jgi:hypothetical protein
LRTRKLSTTRLLQLNAIIFALLVALSLYQVINWNFFPWLNLAIISGTTFLSMIFAMIVKIQARNINLLIIIISGIQFLFSSLILIRPELLRNHWQWLFFPITIIFCLIFWELFSRRNHRIDFTGKISCIILMIITFMKFLNTFLELNNLLIVLILWISGLLIFSKNKPEKSKQ